MSGDDGSAAVLLLAVAAVVLVLAAAIGATGSFLRARIEASAAADAAALAAAPVTFLPFGAAGTPAEEAARFAGMNGADLLSCACPTDPSWRTRVVTVVVARRARLWPFGTVTVTARSRAEFVPALLLGGAAASGGVGPGDGPSARDPAGSPARVRGPARSAGRGGGPGPLPPAPAGGGIPRRRSPARCGNRSVPSPGGRSRAGAGRRGPRRRSGAARPGSRQPGLQQPDRPGLVERFVEVAALGALHARRAPVLTAALPQRRQGAA